ncbi:MAG: septum formation initiator family protein [Spirochaetia bacterium]|nr:septum formation initiator family protein [Spirochaetia bacterium]
MIIKLYLVKIRELLKSSYENWLLWPFLFLILCIIVYNFYFGRNGYLEYQNELIKKKNLENEIASINNSISKLENKIGILKNDKEAGKDFAKTYLYYDNDVQIWKFIDEKKSIEEQENTLIDINSLRNIYIAAVSILILVLTFVFWILKQKSDTAKKEE